MNLRLLRQSMPTEQFEKLTPARKELMEELLAFEQEHRGKEVVADEFQLGRDGKNYSLEMKKILRKNKKIECEEYVKFNWHYDSAGKCYVFKPKETATYRKENAAWKEQIAQQEELRISGAAAVTDAIAGMAKKSTPKPKVAKVKEAAVEEPEQEAATEEETEA